jgi:hypothetical protein
MIGQRIEAQPGTPWGEILSFAAGAAMLAWGVVVASPHPIVAAVLPLSVGLALTVTRQGPFIVEVTENGLEATDPPQHVPYAAIEGLTVGGKPTKVRAPLYVFFQAGVLFFPPRLTVPTSELFGFLAGRISEGGSRDVPTPLAKYLRAQAESFGDANVFSYRARPHPTPLSRKRSVAVSLAVAVTGIVWLIAGFAGGDQYFAWAVVGGIFAFMFTLSALGFAFERKGPKIKNWRQSGLVIGPAGLALVQGDARGEMRWPELRKLEYRDRARSFRFEGVGWHLETETPYRGIHLVVEGARIVIADIYDRPLPLIYDRIRTYWQGRDANA